MRWALAILALAAYVGTAAAEDLKACQSSTIPLKYRPVVQDLSTGTLPIPDYLDAIIGCNTGGPYAMGATAPPRPPSAWLDAERKLYSEVLGRAKADVLVVPFQIQGRGLDRVERALMAADLAYAIGDSGSVAVADPFLTSLALGDGFRRIDMQAAERLAQKIGARQIVAGYVGHDGNHKLTWTLQVTDANRASPRWQHDWRAIAFADDKPPFLVFHDLLPEVLKALPLGLDAKKRPVPQTAALPTALTSPIDVVKAAKPASSSAVLLLLGALAPPGEERARQRLLERALISSMRANAPGSVRTFVDAYALMGLERRPAALARIDKEPSSPVVKALRAILNGDLPGASQEIPQIKDPFQRFLLQLDLRDLQLTYQKYDLIQVTPPVAMSIPRAWEALLDARVDDIDTVKTVAALPIKQTLDAAFPTEGFDARSVVRGSTVARGAPADTIDIDIANARHVRQVASHLAVPECCHSNTLQAGEWDLLWLLQAVGERRIDKALFCMTKCQDRPKQSIEDVNRYEPFFSGHPMLAVATAEASNAIMYRSPDDERDSWKARAQRDALAASWWAQNQSRLGERATLQLGIPSPEANFWIDGYGHDYPLHPSWSRVFIGVEPNSPEDAALAIEALAYSRTDINPLAPLRVVGPPQKYEQLVASLGTRFAGNPQRPPMKNEGRLPDGLADRIQALKQRATRDPNDWGAHYALGIQIIESGGSYSDAQKAFLSYGRFGDLSGRNGVELSNRAFETGAILYYQGKPELARPLYEIAAGLDTGSLASMTSARSLDLLDGRYRVAAETSIDIASRYPSATTYRDYFSLLHLIGEHKSAWEGFSQMKARFDEPQAWRSALVGHRMEGLDENGMRAWLKRPEIRNARFNAQQFASWYATLWSSTDRLPPADLGTFVEELEGAPVAHVDEDGLSTMRPHPLDAKGFEIVEPQRPVSGEPRKFKPGMALKSERAYFADAYSAVARGEYAAAVQRFSEMMDHYPLTGPAFSYLAYAASKTGADPSQTLRIKRLESLPQNEFDAHLARAFFAAPKNVPEARKWLGLALRTRVYTDYRPVLAEFQYAQACEWLLRDTNDDAFRTMLLDWVKAQQKIQPTEGWAYTMQYTYEKDPAERVRALAMGRYLDPSSPRIQQAPAAEVEKAKTWWRDHNPFVPRAREGGPPPI